MNCLCTSETFLSTPLLNLTWSTIWTVYVILRHFYQHHYWFHLIYKMNCLCSSETFLSTPLLISPNLQDGMSLYFWDIHINNTTDLTWSTIWTVFVLLRHFYQHTTDLTWSTRWIFFVLLRHSYQHHYSSHLIYKMVGLCTSETFISTPLLNLTWSTIWTVFVRLRHFYQQHYWFHLIYKMNCFSTSETLLSTPLLISPDLQDELSLFFWDIPINTTTDLTWSRWTICFLLRHSYQKHYWFHLIYKMDCLCTFETLLSTPLLISPDLQDGLSLHFWDIPINTTADLTCSTRWIFIVLLRHSYQHHYWSHLIYKMDCLCTSETFISTPLLILPDLQYGRSLYFWDISINTTTDLTWSTRWTVFVPPKHSYQPHYWSHLFYKMDCLCSSETFISTPLLISPDLQYGLSLYFWDISINTLLISPDLQDELSLFFWDIPINPTTDLTWSTRWTVFVFLRHSYQHHYWSHLNYKINFLCTSETFLSTPLLISPDLQDGLSLYFLDIHINNTTESHLIYKMNCLCSSETFLSTPLLISLDLDGRSVFFWDIPINTTTDLTWSTRLTVFVLLRHIESNTGEYKIEKSPTP